jgi:hypothetical protein
MRRSYVGHKGGAHRHIDLCRADRRFNVSRIKHKGTECTRWS